MWSPDRHRCADSRVDHHRQHVRYVLGTYDESDPRVKEAEDLRQKFQDDLARIFPNLTVSSVQDFYSRQTVSNLEGKPLFSQKERILRDLHLGDILLEGGLVPLSIEVTTSKVDSSNVSISHNKLVYCNADVHAYITPRGTYCRTKFNHDQAVRNTYNTLSREQLSKVNNARNGYMLLPVKVDSVKINNDEDLARFIWKAITDKYTGFRQ